MLTAFNVKNSGVNGVDPEKNGVNDFETEKKRPKRRSTGKIAALTAINGKNSGVNGTELQKVAALTTFTGKERF